MLFRLSYLYSLEFWIDANSLNDNTYNNALNSFRKKTNNAICYSHAVCSFGFSVLVFIYFFTLI